MFSDDGVDVIGHDDAGVTSVLELLDCCCETASDGLGLLVIEDDDREFENFLGALAEVVDFF